MDNKKFYMNLPFELSGSMSKNRFRVELLWGISRMLEIYGISNFTMIFDYVCDIEIHFEDHYEFYQLKSHNSPTTYTLKTLLKPDTNSSILGKLLILNNDPDFCNVKMSVVSNKFLRIGSGVQKDEDFCFNCLTDKEKEGAIKLLEAEKPKIPRKNIEFEKLHYLRVHMNLQRPQYEVKGQLVDCFAKIKKCEPNNPNALFDLLYSEVSSKACYEDKCNTYEEVIQNKGMTKQQFDMILDAHAENSKTGIKQAQEYIDNIPNISRKRKYKKELGNAERDLNEMHIIHDIEDDIKQYFLENEEGFEEVETALKQLIELFGDRFPMEINEVEKEVLCIIFIKKFEEGIY